MIITTQEEKPYFPMNLTHNITSHNGTMFKLSTPVDDSLWGGHHEIVLSKNITASEIVDENGQEIYNLNFKDVGYTALTPHLYQSSPINIKYEYCQNISGRMFVANCRYTGSNLDETEEDKNMVFYSLLNQPNVIPITNFIKCQDSQGGEITGLAELMGNLVVFMQRSIWRLSLPSTNTSQWSLLESSPELGCTAPRSIISTDKGVFFANKEGVYILSQNFIPQEITLLWRDEYQKNYDNDTRIFYSPKNKMLYINQNRRNRTWVLDLTSEKPLWITLQTYPLDSTLTAHGWAGFVNDEELTSYFYDWNESGNKTVLGKLESKSGSAYNWRKKTGWIRLGDLENTKMIRRVNIRYKNIDNTQVPNLSIFINGNTSSPAYTKSGAILFSDSTGDENYVSMRCGVRCKFFAIELINDNLEEKIVSLDNHFEILSFEVEWE